MFDVMMNAAKTYINCFKPDNRKPTTKILSLENSLGYLFYQQC